MPESIAPLWKKLATGYHTVISGVDVYIDGNLGVGLVNGDTPNEKVDIQGNLSFRSVAEPDSALTATLSGTPGNVDDGTHRYKVLYTTDNGYTSISSFYDEVIVVDKTVSGQVELTDIPVSTNPLVTGRRIYRGKAGFSVNAYYFLTEIADNVTTTYTDNTPDSGLIGSDARLLDNKTSSNFFKDGHRLAYFGENNTSVGLRSLGTDAANPTSGWWNFALGNYVMRYLEGGQNNTGLGTYALLNLIAGNRNQAIGASSQYYNEEGYDNIANGYRAAFGIVDASNVISIGNESLYKNNIDRALAIGQRAQYLSEDASYSSTIGYETLYVATETIGMTTLGYQTGYYPAGVVANACTDSSYCFFAGFRAGLGSTTQRTNAIAIGKNAVVDADNTAVIGGQGADAVDLLVTRRMLRSKSVYTGTDTTDPVYLHLCDSATAFTLTVSDGGQDGEEMKIVNRGAGTVTLSGKINALTALNSLASGESCIYNWDVTDDEWQ